MNLVRRFAEVLVPALLVLATALLALEVSSYLQAYFLDTLIKVAIVVGLYVFIGNSGLLSFGQISFVAVAAWTPGVLTVPQASKPIAMPGLAHFLVTTNVGNITSLALAAVIGGAFAFAVGLPLMRLSCLAAENAAPSQHAFERAFEAEQAKNLADLIDRLSVLRA